MGLHPFGCISLRQVWILFVLLYRYILILTAVRDLSCTGLMGVTSCQSFGQVIMLRRVNIVECQDLAAVNGISQCSRMHSGRRHMMPTSVSM